jgi:ketosteroid isomerase-like protein
VSARDEEIISSLRGAYDAFNRADFDTAMEVAHPEIEFIPLGGQSSLKGADALRAWMEPDAFENQQIEPLEFRVQDDKVLVHQLATARGTGSGIELNLDAWAVWTFDEDGRATRVQAFLPHQETEALEAAGLHE